MCIYLISGDKKVSNMASTYDKYTQTKIAINFSFHAGEIKCRISYLLSNTLPVELTETYT